MPEVVTAEQCYHCGEDCREERVLHDEKPFCCTGCKTVYEVLHQHGMEAYYALETRPGSSQKERSQTGLEYLDDQEIIQGLVDFRDEHATHIHFSIPAIHCSSCIWLLEHLPKLHDGILSSRVDFPNRKTTIRFSHDHISLKELVLLLRKIGYEPSLSLASASGAKDDLNNPSRTIWMKLGLAGFAFGNVMLFSLPEYFAPEMVDERLKTTFNLLNFALSIPVLVYSASDYFTSSLQSIKHRYMTMDVPIALGILALFGQSVFDIASGRGPGYFDSFTGLLFFLLIGKAVQGRTFDALSFERRYDAYFPIAVQVIKGLSTVAVPVGKIASGDVIFIRNQELIPADGTLLSDIAEIDYSFVTGESVPVPKNRGDAIYAGGRVKGTGAEILVTKPTSQSYLTRLWNADAKAEDRAQRDHRASIANRISPVFTAIVLLIAVASTTFWLINDSSKALMVCTSVLIIACPCALAMAAPFTLSSVRHVLSKHQFFLKSTLVVEKLAAITHIIFDKTGTLTDKKAFLEYDGALLCDKEEAALRSVLRNSTHPLSIRVYGSLKQHSTMEVQAYEERKGKGIKAETALGSVLFGSRALLTSEGILVPQATGNGTTSEVFLAIGGEFIGRYRIHLTLRERLDDMLYGLLQQEKSLMLVSGDNDHDKHRLMSQLPGFDDMRFFQSPEDKVNAVSFLQQKGQVMMIGDGLNDGAALSRADVGVAVADDIHAFTPASDAILQGDNLHKTHQFMSMASAGMTIVKVAYGLSFAYNVIGLSFAVQGLLSPIVSAILMPLSSITIIAFTTGTTWLTSKVKGL